MSTTTPKGRAVRSSKPPTKKKPELEPVTEEQTVADLRTIAKERGYIGYTKLTKAVLVKFINSGGKKDDTEDSPTPEPPKGGERQKPSTAPRVNRPAAAPPAHIEKPTLRDILPHDTKPAKVVRNIQKDLTPDFLALKHEGISAYIKVVQLGKPGKEGTVYLVTDPENGKRYAMKTFRKKKSGRTLEKEAFYQHLAAKQGISPKVIEYNPEEKYIVMDLLSQTLLDIIKAQGTLTVEQQKQILDIYKRLDSIGIMLNDANPLNIMEKDGRFYAIDYGFAKFTDHKDFKDYPYPNSQLMPLGLILWLKDRHPTKSWTIIRDAISAEARMKMNVDEWP